MSEEVVRAVVAALRNKLYDPEAGWVVTDRDLSGPDLRLGDDLVVCIRKKAGPGPEDALITVVSVFLATEELVLSESETKLLSAEGDLWIARLRAQRAEKHERAQNELAKRVLAILRAN
jgi:hypothetical protein